MMIDPGAEPAADNRTRTLDVDGHAWIAEVTGRCAVGGVLGAAAIESVHFRRRDDPEPVARLAYFPEGVFHALRDEELGAALRSARPLAARPAAGADRDAEDAVGLRPDAAIDYPADGQA